MAGIGGMIAAALLKEVGQQIGSFVGGQIKQQQNFDKDLNQMKSTLESIEALLEDAEHSNTNNTMRLWLKRLTDAMYAISDMLEDFEVGPEAEPTRKFSIKKRLAVMMPCCTCTVVPKFTMANKMKAMREELQGITDQYQKFMLVPGTNADELKVLQMRETSSTIETSIIGRTEEENKIWVSLSESILEKFTVLGIHGIGGLGKTTLAKMVYNNKNKFEDYVRVWIYVSETFDLKKIGNSLISQLSGNESRYTEKEMISRSLGELLANKKILIVLDDLWEEDDSQLGSLTAMLKVGNGSKVVVIATTRNEEIARKISTIPPHELALLKDDMCWTIIKQKSGFESRDDKEQLKDIGEAIAAKCGGVALAAQSIGPILEIMTYNQWKKVRDSDIWKVSSSSSSDPKDKAATQVLASLRLSYALMPRYLKLCFAYWAIFPKGWEISKDDLIHQWISLCFIGSTPTFTAWELGEMYITRLLKLSFLEHYMPSLYDRSTVMTFTMHDLVHDLARLVMDKEILLAGNDCNIGGNRCHYALLNDCSKPLESRRIRALHFMGSAEIRLDGAAFASAKSLRVLDLSECSIHELPDSVGRLKQLRYLRAPRVQHEVIPDSITRLSKLLYLSLRGSYKLSALPESIGEMGGLLYLDLSGCKGIKELPESFGELKKLVHLDLSECYALGNISKIMWSLPDLHYLNLSQCYRLGLLPESLGGLTSLRYLNLRQCLVKGESDNFLDHISSLSNLEYLNLSRNDGITSLPESLGNLRKLHTLNLSWCYKIQKIPESIARIDSLKNLYLEGCDGLVEQPIPHPSTSFVSLPRFEVHVRDGESSSNLVCLQDSNPQVLEIACLENVKSAEEAQSIKLMEKNNLKILRLTWSEGAERFVDDKVLLEELVSPKSCNCLEIIGYNGVSLPTWVSQQKRLLLTRMEHLEELSVSDSSGTPIAYSGLSIIDCPKLKMGPLLPSAVGKLVITRSDNVLSSWGECTMPSAGASSSSSSVLTTRTLVVADSELPMQQWRLLRHLSGLRELHITACPDLTVSPDIIPRLSSVTGLEIKRCNISSLPHWLMDLTRLEYLWIGDCTSIRSLPEGIQQLTKLGTLHIFRCPDLKEWCESEENKMKLAHIPNTNYS